MLRLGALYAACDVAPSYATLFFALCLVVALCLHTSLVLSRSLMHSRRNRSVMANEQVDDHDERTQELPSSRPSPNTNTHAQLHLIARLSLSIDTFRRTKRAHSLTSSSTAAA